MPNLLQLCNVVATYAVALIGTASLALFALWLWLELMDYGLKTAGLSKSFMQFVIQKLKEQESDRNG